MSPEQFVVSSSCMGALEMKGDETAFLRFELAAQCGQVVMGADGKCSDKSDQGVWENGWGKLREMIPAVDIEG